MRWDTIVIGSGPGGLTAAAALVRAGQQVLLLEQDPQPGGWTQGSALNGHRFSPGIQSIGDLHPGGVMRRIYEGLGLGGDLEFCELNPDGFDHYWIGGDRLDRPQGLDRWLRRLCDRFPGERAGIERYFATLGRLADEVKRCASLRGAERLKGPFLAPTLCRWGLRSAATLIESCTQDPALRAVLAAQSGDHGLAPARTSLPLHAIMAAHYRSGACYPRGGGRRIPQAFLRQFRRYGGEARMSARAARILVERGRAVGVETAEGERLFAGSVVSSVDPAVTCGALLGEREARARWRAPAEDEGALVSVLCAVDLDLRAMGFDSGNTWWYRSADVGGIHERMERGEPGEEVEFLFLSTPTLKDPGLRQGGIHAVEMFTFVPGALFGRWRDAAPAAGDEAYAQLEAALAARVLEAAERVIPGIRAAQSGFEVATPLGHGEGSRSLRAAACGAKVPSPLDPWSTSPRGPVDRLYLCGANLLGQGMLGASLAGLSAAQHVLGRERPEDCLASPDGSLRIHPAERPEEWLPDATAPKRVAAPRRLKEVA